MRLVPPHGKTMSLSQPQAHGMMAGYHITATARQRVLKEIAVRAQRHVWDVSFDW